MELSTWKYAENVIDGVNPIGQQQSLDKSLIRRFLNHKHMIETLERFEWKNLPPEIPSDIIERILYFRFKGALFQNDLGRYIFLPFTLKGLVELNPVAQLLVALPLGL